MFYMAQTIKNLLDLERMEKIIEKCGALYDYPFFKLSEELRNMMENKIYDYFIVIN